MNSYGGTDGSMPEQENQAAHPVAPRPDLDRADRYRFTLDSIARSAADISAHANDMGATIQALNEAFAGIAGGGGRDAFAGFGIIGLPLMATWAAIKKVADQTVKEYTQQSLKDWLAFVDVAADEFDRYVATLDSLQTAIANRNVTSTGQDARYAADLERLSDVRHATQAWKVVLGRVERVREIVDALFAAEQKVAADEMVSLEIPMEEKPSADDATDDSGGKPRRTFGRISDMVSDGIGDMVPDGMSEKIITGITERIPAVMAEVMRRVIDSAELRHWMLRPLTDLRDQVQQLPDDVVDLRREVTVLEVKLELAIAQLQALTGTLTDHDVEVMQLRVAGSVLLPGLMADIAHVTARQSEIAAHQARLHESRADGRIGEVAGEQLESHYEHQAAQASETMAELTTDLEAWRADGPRAVDDGINWLSDQLALVEARHLVEDDDQLLLRMRVLDSEMAQLFEVKKFLEANLAVRPTTDEP